jgi:MFS family permease
MSTSENLRASVEKTPPLRSSRGRAAALVLAGTLTVMAGATVAPAIPGIRTAFADTASVDLLSRLVITMPALAIALFAPFAGILVDRMGRKSALVAGIVTFAVGGSSGAYLPDLPTILAGRVVLGIGVSLVMTSSIAMIADLYEGTARQSLVGKQQAATALGGVVFLLGGGALAGLDWRVVFLIYLLSVVLLVPTLLYLPRLQPDPSRPAGAELPKRARFGVPRIIVAPLIAMLLGQVAFFSVPVQMPFLVEDRFGASAFVTGAVIATLTFTVGMVALRFGRISGWASEHRLVALSFLAIGLGCAVIWLAPNLYVVVAGLLAMAAGLGVLMPTLNNWVVSAAPPQERGRYVGFLPTALFLGQFVSPIVTQPVVDVVGIQPAFGVVAVAMALVALAYLLTGRRHA